MNITRETDYAIRLLLYYGAEEDLKSKNNMTLHDLSVKWHVSLDFLKNIVLILVENKTLQIDHECGKISIKRPLEQILLGDFINFFESPDCFYVENFTEYPSLLRREQIFKQAQEEYYAKLNQYSIKNLITITEKNQLNKK